MNNKILIILITLIVFILGSIGLNIYVSDARRPNYPKTQNTTGDMSFNKASKGCGNFVVTKVNFENTAGISVSANSKKLDLTNEEKSFEIGTTKEIDVKMLLGQNIDSLYCNDVLDPNEPTPTRLKAIDGLVTIKINKSSSISKPGQQGTYNVDVTIQNVSFENEDGSQSDMFIKSLFFDDVSVGWYPG